MVELICLVCVIVAVIVLCLALGRFSQYREPPSAKAIAKALAQVLNKEKKEKKEAEEKP